jgi:transcriptional regulator with XRE-family HTH domain
MLGERIREIRKKNKMTLEALAGEELTKGMLSLIENNKANPSMESLAYIAKRLGVELTELLQETSTQKLREILEKAEKLYNAESDDKKQLISLIEPYIPSLTQGYESARLLDIYSRCLFKEKAADWQDFSNRAAKMYDEMNLTAKRASVGIFWALVKFIEHDYSQSLSILLNERSEIESKHSYIDPITRVDLDYHEAILHFAVGNSEAATRVMESAIDFSKEHRIYFRIDDLYRLACAHAVLTNNAANKDHYATKLKQYGEFAEDPRSIIFHELISVMTLIEEKQEYQRALDLINKFEPDPKVNIFHLIEKGKALYFLGQYKEALHCLDSVEVPADTHHPFDLALLYVSDSYKALCYLELGELEQAIKSARLAVEKFQPLPHTSYKDFAAGTYSRLQMYVKKQNPPKMF